jgi:hypothetical protein
LQTECKYKQTFGGKLWLEQGILTKTVFT